MKLYRRKNWFQRNAETLFRVGLLEGLAAFLYFALTVFHDFLSPLFWYLGLLFIGVIAVGTPLVAVYQHVVVPRQQRRAEEAALRAQEQERNRLSEERQREIQATRKNEEEQRKANYDFFFQRRLISPGIPFMPLYRDWVLYLGADGSLLRLRVTDFRKLMDLGADQGSRFQKPVAVLFESDANGRRFVGSFYWRNGAPGDHQIQQDQAFLTDLNGSLLCLTNQFKDQPGVPDDLKEVGYLKDILRIVGSFHTVSEYALHYRLTAVAEMLSDVMAGLTAVGSERLQQIAAIARDSSLEPFKESHCPTLTPSATSVN